MKARLGEGESLVSQLRGEGEKLQAQLVEVGDARELALSELASLQSDLATLQSEKNTQRMAAESVSHSSASASCGYFVLFLSRLRMK